MWKRGVTLSFFILFSVSITTVGVCAEDASEKIILEELNRVRAEAGLSILTVHPLLSSCASDYAAALSQGGYLCHVDSAGKRAVDRFRKRGGTSLRVGEVLGSCPPDKVSKLFDQWLDSPAHRDILLDTRWTHCGVGIAAGWPDGQTKPKSGRHFVVIQCIEHPFTDVTVESSDAKVSVRGSFNPPKHDTEDQIRITLPVLKTGTAVYEPSLWNGEEERFTFILEGSDLFYYLFLGYMTESGNITYTDTVTFFRNHR